MESEWHVFGCTGAKATTLRHSMQTSVSWRTFLSYSTDLASSTPYTIWDSGIARSLLISLDDCNPECEQLEFQTNLNAGNNTISVIYNSSMGSTNYLNLDTAVLGNLSTPQRYEAEIAHYIP